MEVVRWEKDKISWRWRTGYICANNERNHDKYGIKGLFMDLRPVNPHGQSRKGWV